MRRHRVPTALCPECGDFAFKIRGRGVESTNKHQCCDCRHIFVPNSPRSESDRMIEPFYVDITITSLKMNEVGIVIDTGRMHKHLAVTKEEAERIWRCVNKTIDKIKS